MNIPTGKGAFIWQIYNLEGSTVDNVNYEDIVNVIVDAGLTHVYIKVAAGTYPYNVKWENYPWWSGRIQEDFAMELTKRLQQAFVLVFGWHYVRGVRPLDEAKIAIERSTALGLDGFAIDAEAEYKQPGKDKAAEIYAKELRNGIPDIPISLCSYRYPNSHRELPYAQFLRRCDHVAQQLYWEQAHNPVAQLDWSMTQYDKLMRGIGIKPLPQTPVGAGYGTSIWKSTPEDIEAFLKACVDRKLESASLWSMDWMRRKDPALWTALADFDWPENEGPTPPDHSEKLRIIANDLNRMSTELKTIAGELEAD